ncbi:hypothetical protein GEMRC1_003378 [Eukaryota sp. GEM-RC1]
MLHTLYVSLETVSDTSFQEEGTLTPVFIDKLASTAGTTKSHPLYTTFKGTNIDDSAYANLLKHYLDESPPTTPILLLNCLSLPLTPDSLSSRLSELVTSLDLFFLPPAFQHSLRSHVFTSILPPAVSPSPSNFSSLHNQLSLVRDSYWILVESSLIVPSCEPHFDRSIYDYILGQVEPSANDLFLIMEAMISQVSQDISVDFSCDFEGVKNQISKQYGRFNSFSNDGKQIIKYLAKNSDMEPSSVPSVFITPLEFTEILNFAPKSAELFKSFNFVQEHDSLTSLILDEVSLSVVPKFKNSQYCPGNFIIFPGNSCFIGESGSIREETFNFAEYFSNLVPASLQVYYDSQQSEGDNHDEDDDVSKTQSFSGLGNLPCIQEVSVETIGQSSITIRKSDQSIMIKTGTGVCFKDGSCCSTVINKTDNEFSLNVSLASGYAIEFNQDGIIQKSKSGKVARFFWSSQEISCDGNPFEGTLNVQSLVDGSFKDNYFKNLTDEEVSKVFENGSLLVNSKLISFYTVPNFENFNIVQDSTGTRLSIFSIQDVKADSKFSHIIDNSILFKNVSISAITHAVLWELEPENLNFFSSICFYFSNVVGGGKKFIGTVALLPDFSKIVYFSDFQKVDFDFTKVALQNPFGSLSITQNLNTYFVDNHFDLFNDRYSFTKGSSAIDHEILPGMFFSILKIF